MIIMKSIVKNNLQINNVKLIFQYTENIYLLKYISVIQNIYCLLSVLYLLYKISIV